MRIGIIGGGAIGLLAASKLSDNHQITLFTHTSLQADEINEKGITLIDMQGEHNYQNINAVCIDDSEELIQRQEIIILTVKQTALIELWSLLEENASAVVFLQNGMSHFAHLPALLVSTIYTGIVEHGAIRENNHTVHHTGIGMIKMGLYRGMELPGMEYLDTDGFPVQLLPDIKSIHTEKLIINSVINPLTSILGVRNGDLIKNTYYIKLVESICQEVCHSLLIPEAEHQIYLERIITICGRTAKNTSSMLRDLQLDKKTEIEAILGYCIREADKNDIPAPQCKMLFNMVRGMEESEEM